MTGDPDEKLRPIPFTAGERDLVLGLSMMDDDLEKRFKLAVVHKKGFVIHMNAYDLDELLGHIAAVANHETNARRRRLLDALFAKVSDSLERAFPQ